MTIKEACIKAAKANDAMEALIIISKAVGVDLGAMAEEASVNVDKLVNEEAVASWNSSEEIDRIVECMKLAGAMCSQLLPIEFMLENLKEVKNKMMNNSQLQSEDDGEEVGAV